MCPSFADGRWAASTCKAAVNTGVRTPEALPAVLLGLAQR